MNNIELNPTARPIIPSVVFLILSASSGVELESRSVA
jgi:hypothetical protein